MSRRDSQDNNYWIWFLVKKETPKAYLLYDGSVSAWCPKSQILDTDGEEAGEGVVTRLEVKGWIVEEKGWNPDNSKDDVAPKPKAAKQPSTSSPPEKSYDDDIPF